MYSGHIYIDGVSGSGKTTLVNALQNYGYKNIHDGSILSKLTTLSISDLPEELLEDGNVVKRTNQNKINCADYEPIAIYIVLDVDVKSALERVHQRASENNVELNSWNSEDMIKYVRSKYLFMAYKYGMPIIDTSNKQYADVVAEAIDLLSNKENYILPFPYKQIQDNDYFESDLLELEWLNMGDSVIIYADQNCCVHRGVSYDETNFKIEEYQETILNQITKNNLALFLAKNMAHPLRD